MPPRKGRMPRPPRAARPSMPGYGVAKTRRGLLPWTWAAQRLRNSHNYWIITTRPDGAPHAMPVWGLWLDDRFYFSTGGRSRKSRNLAANPRCVVCNERADQAAIVEGTAAPVADPALVAKLAPAYERKYRPWKLDPNLGPIYEVHPRVVFGVVEKTFPGSATRWEFGSQPPGRAGRVARTGQKPA
jgi:nitroimidazol reductase NimA-like FMN-containing flavoprotein (pyridoxamine 5'-phosphate oxidase superfamily)